MKKELNAPELKNLVAKGKKRGFLTEREIVDALQDVDLTPDLLGNDYSTEVIDSSYYPCCLHAHPSLVIILPWPNSAYALEPIPLSVKSGWNREGRGRITQSCEENTKEAYDDLLSGCCIPICDYPTPFGTEQPVHGIQQPLIDQRPNLGIMLQSLDCNTTLSLVR
jgi:hypothetical protein